MSNSIYFKQENGEIMRLGDKDAGRKHGGPKSIFMTNSGLSGVGGAENFTRGLIDLLAFIPSSIRIKFNT